MSVFIGMLPAMTITATETPRIACLGESALYCPLCDNHLPEHYDDALLLRGIAACPSCDTVQTLEEYRVAVRAADAHLLDIDTARSAIWYHATTSPTWHQDMLNSADTECGDGTLAIAHLGTLKAAMERAYQVTNFESNNSAQWWIYQVVLTDEAEMAEQIKGDENEDAPCTVGECETAGYSPSITRYINRYESVGSISLIANPAHIKVIATAVMKRDDVATRRNSNPDFQPVDS